MNSATALRTGDVWELFSSNRSAAETLLNRAAKGAGLESPGSGRNRSLTPPEVAGLLAVKDLGSGRNNPVADPCSIALFELVRDNTGGWCALRIRVVQGHRLYADPTWHYRVEDAGCSQDGMPTVVFCIPSYHRRVADHLGRLS